MPDAIPIVYRGQQYPSRQALAEYLAPLTGRTVATLMAALSKHAGDVERVLAARLQRRPIAFEGQIFPHRKALAEYLAPRMNRPTQSVEGLLLTYRDDVQKVFAAAAARPYRPKPPPRRRASGRAGAGQPQPD